MLVTTPTEVIVTVDLKPGTLFHSRYEILNLLGRGGMGMVYKARDRSLDEVVAIKILRPDFADEAKMADRFKSEIKLARKVRHRNVCTIHDYGEDRGLLYISMEFVEGVDLKRLLRENGGLPANEAYDLAIQIAEGLQAVHDAGIIHRDLKTPNVMRDAQGVARLMDFGIAKRQGEATLTATGAIVGTPEYMSPEQAQGQKVDFRSDIYALGVLTFELFTGQVPFKGETPISTILKQMNDPPPLEGPPAAKIPGTLKPVLRKALAKDPADRYLTARDFAQGLQEARSPSRRQQPIPTEVLQAPTLPRAAIATARPRLQPWLLVVPLVAIAGGVALLWRHAPEAMPAPGPAATPSVPLPAPSAPPQTEGPFAAPMVTPEPSPAAAASVPAPNVRAATGTPHGSPAAPKASPVRASPSTLSLMPIPAPSLSVSPPAPSAPAAMEGTGFLLVVVRPWASVSVDGRSQGETPLDQISLSAGPHSVRVRHPAFEAIERQVTIRPGQTERLVVDLPSEGVRKP